MWLFSCTAEARVSNLSVGGLALSEAAVAQTGWPQGPVDGLLELQLTTHWNVSSSSVNTVAVAFGTRLIYVVAEVGVCYNGQVCSPASSLSRHSIDAPRNCIICSRVDQVAVPGVGTGLSVHARHIAVQRLNGTSVSACLLQMSSLQAGGAGINKHQPPDPFTSACLNSTLAR